MVDVAVIGCGAPGRSMGWYHAKQLVEGRISCGRLTDVVEPWLLGSGRDTRDAASLLEWFQTHAPEVRLHAEVFTVPLPTSKAALVACRTADAPAMFRQTLKHGFSHIYLEKPGAGTVEELKDMDKLASEAGTLVVMGFNKNVSRYVAAAVASRDEDASRRIIWEHLNDVPATPVALAECFERNGEGLVKNMCIHELALLATFDSLTADVVSRVEIDPNRTHYLTLQGPVSKKTFTDYVRLGVVLHTKDGRQITFRADRCGRTNESAASVVDQNGKLVLTTAMPDNTDMERIATLKAEEPEVEASYLHTQDPDYVELKSRFTRHIAQGTSGSPPGLATLKIGIEALRLAELINDVLASQRQEACL